MGVFGGIVIQVSGVPSPKFQHTSCGRLDGVEFGTARKARVVLVMEGVISTRFTLQVTGTGGIVMLLHFVASQPP